MIYLPNKGKRGRMLIGFLPNKESIREARANPMHFHSLGELASEEPSESGRNVGTLHLRKPLPLWRRRLPCSCNAIEGTNKTWLHGESGSAEGAPNGIGGGGSQTGSEVVGQHDGSVISCVGTDRDDL